MVAGHQEQSRRGEPAGSERHWSWPGAASTPPSPTSPGHYAVLEAVFLSGLGAVVLATRRRERLGDAPISGRELPVMAAAVFALADTLAKEKVSTWLREPFVLESSDHKPLHAEGSGLRYAVGELLTCTRCVGTWSALALVGLRTVSPPAGRATSNVLALAGVNDVAQSAFRLLAERTNLAVLDTQAVQREAPAKPARPPARQGV